MEYQENPLDTPRKWSTNKNTTRITPSLPNSNDYLNPIKSINGLKQ